MSRRRRAVLLTAFAVPALLVLVLALGDGGDAPAALLGATAVGGVCAAVAAVALSIVRRQTVPLPALAVACVVVPVVLGAVGFWVRFAASDVAGSWLQRLSLVALALTVLAVLASLVPPRRPRLTHLLCATVLATLVPAGVLLAVAQTADGRHREWVGAFPAADRGRAPTEDEVQYVPFLEVHLATRVWDDAGLDCDEMRSALARHAGTRTAPPEDEVLAPGVACVAEANDRWRATRAVVTDDGRLVVAAWSPTADLFVF